MIKFLDGNFWHYPADARINTVNCVGVMGKGVALEFKERYPTMFRVYQKLCKGGAIKPGHVWEYVVASNFTIFNMATKDHWRNPSQYIWIKEGLVTLRRLLENSPRVRTITIPALGCGNGGLQWANVSEMIEDYLDGLPQRILVFNPSQTQ
jgi:O-acetyl-ADP-ribose deacetylase (regulator of RNase III)